MDDGHDALENAAPWFCLEVRFIMYPYMKKTLNLMDDLENKLKKLLGFLFEKNTKRASLIPPWWLWSHWVVSPGSWWQVVPNGEEKWWTLGQGGLGSCRPTVTWRKRPFFRNVLNDQVVVSQFQTCLFLGNCHIFLKLCSISEVDIHTLVKANQLVFHPFPLFLWGMFPFRYISFRYVGDHQLVNLDQFGLNRMVIVDWFFPKDADFLCKGKSWARAWKKRRGLLKALKASESFAKRKAVNSGRLGD